MLEIQLAELLDRLVISKEAHLVETERSVSVSGLSYASTAQIFRSALNLKWGVRAFDSSNSEWNLSTISEEFAPYRVTIVKPEFDNAVLHILSNVGFAKWLSTGHDATTWRIARLRESIVTRGRLFTNWKSSDKGIPSPATKSPRTLVRETAGTRIVPQDIQVWLLHHSGIRVADPVFRTWANASIRVLLYSLSEEIISNGEELKFKGPPKLTLAIPSVDEDLLEELGELAFNSLQQAADWVFELEREAELKHGLLMGEIARAGGQIKSAVQYFKSNIADAFDAAKIAYQVAISELGKDTLKLLGELRKAVTEETGKVTEGIRQTITAVASGLAVGFGLLAARLNTTASPWLLIVIMLVVTTYVAMVIYSGWGFISLQRSLREQWQPRLYRFLPPEEYSRMVSQPTKKTENVFLIVAALGGFAVACIMIAVTYVTLK